MSELPDERVATTRGLVGLALLGPAAWIAGGVVVTQPIVGMLIGWAIAIPVGWEGIRTLRMGVYFAGESCTVRNSFRTYRLDVREIARFEEGTYPGLVTPVGVLVTTAGRRLRLSAIIGPNPRIIRDDTRVANAVRRLNWELQQRVEAIGGLGEKGTGHLS